MFGSSLPLPAGFSSASCCVNNSNVISSLPCTGNRRPLITNTDSGSSKNTEPFCSGTQNGSVSAKKKRSSLSHPSHSHFLIPEQRPRGVTTLVRCYDTLQTSYGVEGVIIKTPYTKCLRSSFHHSFFRSFNFRLGCSVKNGDREKQTNKQTNKQ